ncbi:MAG: M3 family metallopeptidase, partial [Planctomycetota bacterium]
DPAAERVERWQTKFLSERVKRRRFDFDSQAVRPYFAYDRVEDGVLRITEDLYGVEVRRNADEPVWHASVKCFDIVEGGEVRARFYLDMFPREGKYKHAAMFDINGGDPGGSGRSAKLPAAALVCNFPEPKDGDPGLLLHDQVTTVFHEFGHLLHHLFAVQPWYGFSGIRCEWDFVEVPSQLYEEWAWKVDVLQRFALHHETGEPIPSDLVERLRAAEEYGKALGVVEQMLYAKYALELFDSDPSKVDPHDLMVRLRTERTFGRHYEGTAMECAFGHLHGYSASYYTYMWSLVIAKDFLGRFGDDLMDPVPARRYRDAVLAPGGARDAVDLARDFLGREVSYEAWEAWLAAS